MSYVKDSGNLARPPKLDIDINSFIYISGQKTKQVYCTRNIIYLHPYF